MISNSSRSLSTMLHQLYAVLEGRRRLQLLGLWMLMLVSAVAELVTLGAILPFVGALVQPELVLENPAARTLAAWLGITSPEQMLFPLTVSFATAATVAGMLRVLLARVNATMAYMIGADLGLEVFSRTLYQPYEEHLRRNSSEVISGVTRKVDGVVRGILMATLNIVSSGLLFFAAFVAILMINFQATMIVAVVFGTAYVGITISMRKRLRRYGEIISKSEGQVFRALHEGIGGIRDIIVYNKQGFYQHLYRNADVALRRAQADSLFISQFPRYTLEAVAMVLIAIVAYVEVTGPNGGPAAVPTLAALALGGQRMLPALQMAYAGWSTLTHSRPILADVLDLLRSDSPVQMHSLPAALPFERELTVENLHFHYQGEPRKVLCGVTLSIMKGSRVGFIGETGAGKSTLVDVIVGLLKATEGRILVDGAPLTSSRIRSWHDKIAQVPQQIHLVDGSFIANIALGVSENEVDMEAIERAARRARIADVIATSSEGYQTMVGENGVKLSGGQRQRLGIARALYRNPEILVFDEATSALDVQTEQDVIATLDELSTNLTILMIAHRTATLKDCDIIHRLDRGQIVWSGSFTELRALDEA